MRPIHVIGVVIFVLLFTIGLSKSSSKFLWNDEYYSLTKSTLGISYGDMLKGRIPEGNNSPLFYFLQKLQCDLFSYQKPSHWIPPEVEGRDPYSQIFLRIQPVFCMAFALSLLFYYFSTRCSLWAGSYALLVALSSFMFWAHWTEARPYALWFLLSTAHMMVLLEWVKRTNGVEGEKCLHLLLIGSVLLSLTVTIGVLQIIAAIIVVWFSGYRRWLFFALMLLPIGISLFYYATAPKYDFFFVDGPMSLFNANFPKDRIFIFIIFILFFIYKNWGKKEALRQAEFRFFLFASCLCLFFAAVLLKLKMAQTIDHRGFQISNRYFLSLTPLSIIGTTVFSVYLFRSIPSKIGRGAIFLLLAVLLFFRIQRTPEIMNLGIKLDIKNGQFILCSKIEQTLCPTQSTNVSSNSSILLARNSLPIKEICPNSSIFL